MTQFFRAQSPATSARLKRNATSAAKLIRNADFLVILAGPGLDVCDVNKDVSFMRKNVENSPVQYNYPSNYLPDIRKLNPPHEEFENAILKRENQDWWRQYYLELTKYDVYPQKDTNFFPHPNLFITHPHIAWGYWGQRFSESTVFFNNYETIEWLRRQMIMEKQHMRRVEEEYLESKDSDISLDSQDASFLSSFYSIEAQGHHEWHNNMYQVKYKPHPSSFAYSILRKWTELFDGRVKPDNTYNSDDTYPSSDTHSDGTTSHGNCGGNHNQHSSAAVNGNPEWTPEFDPTKSHKNSLVYTTSIEGPYKQLGFDTRRVVELYGSFHFLQCAKNCDNYVWLTVPPPLEVDIEEDLLSERNTTRGARSSIPSSSLSTTSSSSASSRSSSEIDKKDVEEERELHEKQLSPFIKDVSSLHHERGGDAFVIARDDSDVEIPEDLQKLFEQTDPKIVAEIFGKDRNIKNYLPRCGNCGAYARPNVKMGSHKGVFPDLNEKGEILDLEVTSPLRKDGHGNPIYSDINWVPTRTVWQMVSASQVLQESINRFDQHRKAEIKKVKKTFPADTTRKGADIGTTKDQTKMNIVIIEIGGGRNCDALENTMVDMIERVKKDRHDEKRKMQAAIDSNGKKNGRNSIPEIDFQLIRIDNYHSSNYGVHNLFRRAQELSETVSEVANDSAGIHWLNNSADEANDSADEAKELDKMDLQIQQSQSPAVTPRGGIGLRYPEDDIRLSTIIDFGDARVYDSLYTIDKILTLEEQYERNIAELEEVIKKKKMEEEIEISKKKEQDIQKSEESLDITPEEEVLSFTPEEELLFFTGEKVLKDIEAIEESKTLETKRQKSKKREEEAKRIKESDSPGEFPTIEEELEKLKEVTEGRIEEKREEALNVRRSNIEKEKEEKISEEDQKRRVNEELDRLLGIRKKTE